MKINTFKYFIIDALKSLKRNKTVSIAAVATVAATLFILGVFLLTLFNVKQGMKEIGSNLEIKVFLKNDITISQNSNIKRTLNEIPGVASVEYETKVQALEKVKEQLGEDAETLVEGFEQENPFPNSYVVSVEKPEMVEEVVSKIKDLEGIEKVKDARQVVERIIRITRVINWVGLGLFAVFIGVSLFLIGNTIKLTVYSRQREIGIMKYVGATDWFIRWPFILEGITIGIIGAILSTGILFYAYKIVFAKVPQEMIVMQLVSPTYVLTTILWEFILGGMMIGAIGSMISIRKFLKV